MNVRPGATSVAAPAAERLPNPSPPSSVSLVICTRNRSDMLIDTVRSILAGDLLPSEILIVDQSDLTDPEAAAIVGPEGCVVHYRHLESRGLSRARNEALGLVAHALIVFTDDDVIVTKNWLRSLLDVLIAADHHTVVTGRVLPASATGRGFVPTLKGGDIPVTYRGPSRADPLVTFNMAAYHDWLLKVGGFDERIGPGTRFPAGEDNEIAHRMLKAGGRIEYTPDAVVYHRAWRPEKEYVGLRWGYGLGQGAFFGMHASPRDPAMFRRFAGSVLNLLARSVTHFWKDRIPGRELSPGFLFAGDIALMCGLVAGFAAWAPRSPSTDVLKDR